jgi:hypothetical protein
MYKTEKIDTRDVMGTPGFTCNAAHVEVTMGITQLIPAGTSLEVIDVAGKRTWAKFYMPSGRIHGWIESSNILIDTTHLLDAVAEFNSPI